MQLKTIKFGIDCGLIVTFVLVFVTGIIKWPGFFANTGLSHLVLPMNQISLIHDRSGFLFGIIVIIHLLLNAKWLVSTGKGLFR
ncbi:MAG: hypothetical protein APR53_07585 [Methanoculleus sp. SDB]|nr:MAG: hypothetical protein APR53_07585 [Methanoculleus sp. SDB]